MAWTHILFLSVGIDVMVKVSYFASRGSGYWAEVGRLISFITEHLCSLVFCSHEARWDSLEVCLAWICVCSTCEDFFHWCPCCLSHVLGHVQPFLPPYGSNVPVSGQSAFTSLVERVCPVTLHCQLLHGWLLFCSVCTNSVLVSAATVHRLIPQRPGQAGTSSLGSLIVCSTSFSLLSTRLQIFSISHPQHIWFFLLVERGCKI